MNYKNKENHRYWLNCYFPSVLVVCNVYEVLVELLADNTDALLALGTNC